MNKPLLICMTPVRNEVWVLHAFLKATSIWADYIIIADQMSIDGSREIALSYPKVILIDNNDPNYNEANRQKLLINKAREIKGDKILFGLDADEVFTANFKQTEDWEKILNSKPGDVFLFKWALVCPDKEQYLDHQTYFPWVFHDDGKEQHENYVRNMHSMRIPYPIDEMQLIYVNDFRVLHLVSIHVNREISKRRFYKIVDYKLNKRSIVSISRMYSLKKSNDEVFLLPDKWVYNYRNSNFDLFEELSLSEGEFWFDSYVLKNMENNANLMIKIDIWDEKFLSKFKITDSRSKYFKLVHWYLKETVNCQENLFVKIIDKILLRIE